MIYGDGTAASMLRPTFSLNFKDVLKPPRVIDSVKGTLHTDMRILNMILAADIVSRTMQCQAMSVLVLQMSRRSLPAPSCAQLLW